MPISKAGLERLAEIIWEIIGDRSIRKFALDIGCNHTTVIRLLSGNIIPDIPTLQKIAQNSQYSTSQLVAILVEESPPNPRTTLERISEAARNLSLDEKKQLIALLFEEMSPQERQQTFKNLFDALF